MSQKEAKARLKINSLLADAGWRLLDDGHRSANVLVEQHVKLTKHKLDDYGEDFENTSKGFVDFTLLDDHGKPLAVLEAKSEDKDPLIGKEQARTYAKGLYVDYILLSNGNIHYLWNIKRGNPQVITAFPSLSSLSEKQKVTADPERLSTELINRDFIAITQMPRYAQDLKYQNELTRKSFIAENNLRFLRQYQINAVKALQAAAAKGQERYLFEMATGTGKTLVSSAIIKLFLRTGNARRVLFLVDRIELENQALKNFNEHLKNDYHAVIFKQHVEDWRKAEIVVSTVQTLLSNNKYRQFFKPMDFDLVISDEAHRSINGNSRAVFEYFTGYKLGLTATPKDYLKNLDSGKSQEKDPRAWERRQLLDTYRTFGCESGEPTFRYSLVDGVQDPEGPFLINPTVMDARTEITTKLLSEQGYAVVGSLDDDQDENDSQEKNGGTEEAAEGQFFAKDFEKKFFSDATNQVFCETFMKHAKRDPITNEIGKSIIFAVSRKHASKLSQVLNVLADQMYPDMYQSDFAMQITSDIPNAQQFTVNFQNNNLSGHSKAQEGYKTSKTRVCITVGMMTTGYDCQDLLNVVLLRPIFSPTDFVQIKGRGTRLFTFEYQDKRGPDEELIQKPKDTFLLFDFFGNYEYFEEKFKYDQVIELPKFKGKPGGEPPPPPPLDEYQSDLPDSLTMFVKETIGLQGMKIDRKLYEKFEQQIKADPFVREQYEQGNIAAAEKHIETELFNKATDYVTLDKLKKALHLDRRLSLREVMDKAFGIIPRFKNKHELVEDEFLNFQQSFLIPVDKFHAMKYFFETYLTDKNVRRIVEDREFQLLANNPTLSMNDLKSIEPRNVEMIVDYIKDHVNINRFAS